MRIDPIVRAASAALLLGSSLAWPAACGAQVIELSGTGTATVYDRPAVFGPTGATPIPATAPAPQAAHFAVQPNSDPRLLAAAAEAGLSADLIEAVARQESGFQARIVSRAGAVGEMQLMPATAKAFGTDPYDSAQNYRAGAHYLAALMRRYNGDLMRALAAYNAGPGAVDRYGGVPPFRETQEYINAIMNQLSVRAVQNPARR